MCSFCFVFVFVVSIKHCTNINSVKRYTYMWNRWGEQPGRRISSWLQSLEEAVESWCAEPLLLRQLLLHTHMKAFATQWLSKSRKRKLLKNRCVPKICIRSGSLQGDFHLGVDILANLKVAWIYICKTLESVLQLKKIRTRLFAVKCAKTLVESF